MKKFLKYIRLENIKDKLTALIPYFLPENWSQNKKPYILFWSIVSFTIIFIILAQFLHMFTINNNILIGRKYDFLYF